jgi:2-polyprenyl-3-methyl-5-hydroxy-6-metoxy-1,4-benzoquinol methylase
MANLSAMLCSLSAYYPELIKENPSKEEIDRMGKEVRPEFIERSEFIWHQRFELAPGVWTPGTSPVAWLCEMAQLPADLSGLTALDVGTTNAGTAFELERRGAARVVALDIYDPDWFGVRALSELLNSKVEYVQGSVYELSWRFAERFDIVIFWGVLYHLRHPLMALATARGGGVPGVARDRDL